MKLISKPFDWHDNFSEIAIEDYEMYKDSLGYCAGQTIGMALTKLQLIENGELDNWIPCSERLPKRERGALSKPYLVCTNKGGCAIARYEGRWKVSGSVEIVAWKELPKSYKGE